MVTTLAAAVWLASRAPARAVEALLGVAPPPAESA
jgi:hypothetical protein